MSESNALEVARVNTRLRVVEEEFDREMRARGFDPAQDDNVAFTGPLASLYAEREDLREQLQSLVAEHDDVDNH